MDQAGDAIPVGELLDERRHLLAIACWMLGRGRAAESVVTETYRQWYALPEPDRVRLTDPRSWLSRTAVSICLARLAPPERLGTDPRRSDAHPRHPGTDPRRNGVRSPRPDGSPEDEVSQVLLDALDALSPGERAAFVLKDVFGMAPGAVADVVGQTERECAELAERARHSLRARRARPTTPERHDLVVRAVGEACAVEDTGRLTSLLAADVTAFFDGGGKVRALTRPVHGHLQVARSLLTLLARHPHTTTAPHSVNGRTGLVVRHETQVAAVISLDIAGSHVVQVWVVLNPDKLRVWNRTELALGRPGPQDDTLG
ncbi:RNA polymerase subunit sigma [Streptomyces sp. NPDC127072]|uniref:RNA polymerase subunit sigma n=1 Tax=Streptomyces sp. NPDC127072 TaxID=3347129 RepID=UPI003666C879